MENTKVAVENFDWAAFENESGLYNQSKEEIEALLREELNEINRTLPQYKQMRGLEVRETEFEKTTSRKIKRHKI